MAIVIPIAIKFLYFPLTKEMFRNNARKKKAKHISLYTNPKRIAANAMYQEIGFFKKDTNYYRINLLLPKPTSVNALEKNISKRKALS